MGPASVGGLVVEGSEGGGFKNPRDVASMALLPLVCSQVIDETVRGFFETVDGLAERYPR